MNLIFKSMVSLVVLANLATAASRDEADTSSASRPVFALPYKAADDLFRDMALNADRVQGEIGMLVLVAPQNPRIGELNDMLARLREKLAMRKAQWEGLKVDIRGVRTEMESSVDGYLASCAKNVNVQADQFINLVDQYLQPQASAVYSKETVLDLANRVFSTRQNINGLTEILAELEAEVKGLQK